MARTRNESLHQQRRDEILRAAARVFKAKGFHLARTEEICVEAQMSAGTVFRHFPDKRAMISAIAEIEAEHYQRELQRLASKEGLQWLARITESDFAEMMRPTPFDLGTDSWLELARDPAGKEQLLAFDKKLRASLVKVLTRGQSEGWVRESLDPRGGANLILSMFTGLTFDLEMGFSIERRPTARALADFFRTFVLKR